MSDISDDEDPIDNIDFSVISNSIEAGGNTLDQILNAVHYGSPEIRHLLRESCDFIFECKHCKNLFRAIPNFIAHKRIYCGDKSFFQNTTKKKPKKKEEVVIVRPVSPSLSVPVEIVPKEGEKTVLEQILTGSFQGSSEAYKHYTEAATHVEKQNMIQPSSAVVTSVIKNTQNAVNVNVIEKPLTSGKDVVSNATAILEKAKKSKKQALTKIVDGLKKSATSSNSESSSSPKKIVDKKATGDCANEVQNKSVATVVKPVLESKRKSNKTQTKTDSTVVQKHKEKVENNSSALKSGKTEPIKSVKVVLTQLPDKAQISEKKNSTVEKLSKTSSSSSSYAEVVKTGKSPDKSQTSKISSNDLRPVKTQNGSELSELSQLGHCDLDKLKCLICNLQYTQKKTLLQHMHVIHSDTKRKYPCTMCSKTFDYFWGLTRHLLLNHKKTKEEIDRMRPELRGLAYTVNELSKIEDSEHTTDKNQSTMKTARRNQVTKTIVKMNTCDGCHKSFWQKKNYEEHAKQCGFLAAGQSQKKVTKNSPTKEEHSTTPSTESVASRRKKTVQKLAESRVTKDTEDDVGDNTPDVADDNGGSSMEGRKAASANRLRIGGKFVSKEFQQKMQENLKKERETNEKTNENKSSTSKNKVVKKLKEKSRNFVPAQRFISTRRSAEFYHTPAQRTRFHDKRRAVVSSPKKDSPSKSPRKACDKMSESGSESSMKQSPEQKSELELARRNLLQAIEKGQMKDDDNTTEKTRSPVKKGSTASPSGKKLADSETGRSRSVSRRSQSTPSRDGSTDGMKKPGAKLDRKPPQSRDSSIDSVRSRKSTRTHRDTSRDLSVESVRSRKSIRAQRDTSRDLSVESVRSCQSTRSLSRGKLIAEKAIGKGDEKEADIKSRSRLSTRQSAMKDSQDSTNENVADIKSPGQNNVAIKQSEGKTTESLQSKTSDDTVQKLSSLKNVESKSDEKLNRKNVKNSPTQKSDGKKSSPTTKNASKVTASKKSPGKDDEVDGTKQGGQAQKVKPKWSTKNWTDRKPADPLDTLKIGTKRGTSANKGKMVRNEGKLKGVTKHKVMKAKARYATRSMKTRIQTAKKIGELKKRQSTRISAKKNDDDSKTQDEAKEEKDSNSDKNKDITSKQKPIDKILTPPNTDKKSNPKDVEKNVKVKSKEEVKMSPARDKKIKTVKTSPASKLKGKVETPEKIDKRKSVGKIPTSPEIKTKCIESEKKSVKSSESKDVKEENVGTSDDDKSGEVTVYSHRPRIASDMEGVKIIEEIWVSKEIGQPLQSVKCKKTIIESPKKSKAGRMYVVDSADTDPDKSKCLDFSRINHLVDYKNNKCLQCGLELTDISSLRRHAVRHLGWKRYKCRLCAYTGFNRSECNSHIKRRHAEKLIASSSPLSSFIIDLNKEASDVRNRKKKSTMKKKTITEKSEKVSDTGPRTLRKSSRKSIESANSKSEKTESLVTENLPASRSRSNSGPPEATTSLESQSTDNEAALTRKRKRAISEEGAALEIKIDNLTTMSTSEESEHFKQQSDPMTQTMDDNLDDLEEELHSVSDYEDNNDPPPRNVVSPTWTKMNANVALMMATLEEARATKFSRGKRGRGGLRKFSPPLRKYPRLSTDDSIDQDTSSLKDDNEELSPLDSNVNKNTDSTIEKEKEQTEENIVEESPKNPQSTENNKVTETISSKKSEKLLSESTENETLSKDEKTMEIKEKESSEMESSEESKKSIEIKEKESSEMESSEESKKSESTTIVEEKCTEHSSVNKEEENDTKESKQSSEEENVQSVKSNVQSVISDVESVKSDVQSVRSDVESVKSVVQSVKSDAVSIKSDEIDSKKVNSEIVDMVKPSANKVKEETDTKCEEEITKSGEETKQDSEQSKKENTAV